MKFQNRRAAVEVQFNWIFILIAGALILTLFTTIVLKQKSVSQVSSHAALLKALSAIAIGSQASPGVTSTLDLPQATIGIECNLIRIASQSQQFEQMMVFAPSSLRSSPLVSMTLEWSVPYRVSNIVYLSSPKVRYILIGDTPLSRQMNKSMPKGLEVEWYPNLPSGIRPRGDDSARFIFFGPSAPSLPPGFEDVENLKVSALHVDGDSRFGTAGFYAKSGDRFALRQVFPYLKQQMLLGAMISDSEVLYGCIATNMVKRLSLVSQVYSQRTSDLSQDPSLSRCQGLYADAIPKISLIGKVGLNEGSASQLDTAITSLESANSELQRQSCPLLY